MSTIVGVKSDGVVALAADRANVTDGTVTGSVDRLFEFGAAGAVAVGDTGSVDSFGRRLEAEIDSERLEHDREIGVGRLSQIAADIAAEENVEAIVAAPDGEGGAGLRSVDSQGAVLDDTVAAFGNGAQMAMGILEGEAVDEGPADPEAYIRDLLETVVERHAETGDEIDSWSLSERS